MYTISSNGFSADQQTADALDWLRLSYPEVYSEVRRNFPETIRWSGSWFDTDAMGVDVEWGSWLCDAIEDTELVVWIDGDVFAIDN